jgi:hypothetical protein
MRFKTEETMEAWEKATITVPPKAADYGQIGRAKEVGFNLADLSTENLMNLLREITVNFNWEAKIKARSLVENYDRYKKENKL